MTNENNKFGHNEFGTKDEFSSKDDFKNNDHQFHGEENTKPHDDFGIQDDFNKKQKLSAKDIDKGKVAKAVLFLLIVVGGVVAAVYFKLQKNKETRAATGIESAVTKPVEADPSGGANPNNPFGFGAPQPITPPTTEAAVPTAKTPEELELERQLAEQQAKLAEQQEQARQEAIAREQALLNARYKSGIMVDGSGSGSKGNGVSPNGDASGMAGVPPELAPFLMGMQGSQQAGGQGGASGNNVNPRIANNSAGSMGGRFDSSTNNQKAPIAHASYNADRRMLIQQGKIIDAVLETAVKSDLPSNIIARVTNDIYSEQGRNRLLPAGTRLFGQYSSIINDGQAEIAAVWNRAITPNGVEIMLDSPSTNGLGIAGLGGKVNNHYGRIFGTATLLSLIGAGVSNVGVNSSDQNNASQTYRTEVANSFGNQADRVLQRNLSIPPTITVKHGSRIKVLVAKDLDFSTILNQ
ncbi:TPA: hypothetical protein OUI11_003407 [Acinetobacter baumannii]|nr:hypothetical protein [Acinetobacter baumannii]